MQTADVAVPRVLRQPDVLPLRTPPTDLPVQIADGFPEVAESDRVRVDRVQIGQHLDQGVDASGDLGLAAEFLQFSSAAHHPAGHKGHHAERRAEHGIVLDHGDRLRHRNAGVGQRGDHPILAGHVVCRGSQTMQRWTAQHPL